MKKSMLFAVIATVVGLSQSATAGVDLKVISGPATAGVLAQVAARFVKETGYGISKHGGVTGVLKQIIASGEPFDVAIIPAPLIESFLKEGKIAADTSISLARVGVGLAARSGVAKPDVSSVLALKQTLLKAKSITYVPTGEAANQLAKTLSSLGITDQLKDKLHPKNTVADCIKSVSNGESDFYVSLTNIIASAKELELVGPFPPELQHYLIISVGMSSATKEPKASRALIKLLTSDDTKIVIRANGLEPVAP